MLHYIYYLSLWTITLTNQSIKRIGFACKWAEINKKGEIVSAEGLNTGGTTQAWAKRNSRSLVEEKIMDVAKRNIMNTHALVKKVATLEKTVSQVATHSHIDFRWRYFYNDETMSAIDEHEKLLSIFFQFFCDETDEITLDRWISFARILQVDLERYQLALLFKWSCSLG